MSNRDPQNSGCDRLSKRGKLEVEIPTLSAMKALGLGILMASVCARAATITVCDEGALRAAISQGGIIDFNCSGTITLTDTLVVTNDCVIDATGQNVALSGGNEVRVFYIAPGVEVALLNLTIASGRWSSGAGIYNAGKLVAGNCRIINNVVRGYGVETVGGGIHNVGDLLITNSLVGTNIVAGLPGPPGGHGTPAIDMVDQYGRCRTIVPATPGGSGMDGGPASGGGLFNEGTATVLRTIFAANGAHGGAGGDGGNGGAPAGCTGGFSPGGAAGAGGSAAGGALASTGSFVISDSLLVGNEASGGPGGRGGRGIPWSAAGGRGGEGEGGGVENRGSMVAWNVTVSGNIARGGAGGLGGAWSLIYNLGDCPMQPNGAGGNASGGGIAAKSTFVGFTGTNLTIWNNRVEAGTGTNALVTATTNCPAVPGSNGLAFGASIATVTGYMWLWNSIAGNLAVTNNVFGMYVGDHNLCSDASADSTGPGNLNNVDPQLSPLTENGGPTLTHALRRGSIAIDAARNNGCPAADQRGVSRPQHGLCDIGAYEAAFATVAFAGATDYRVEFEWLPLQRCRLQASADLIAWHSVETKTSGADGRVSFEVPRTTRQFFRVTSP